MLPLRLEIYERNLDMIDNAREVRGLVATLIAIASNDLNQPGPDIAVGEKPYA